MNLFFCNIPQASVSRILLFFSFSKNLLNDHISHYPKTQGTKMCSSDYRFPFQSHMQDPVTLGTGKEEQNTK